MLLSTHVTDFCKNRILLSFFWWVCDKERCRLRFHWNLTWLCTTFVKYVGNNTAKCQGCDFLCCQEHERNHIGQKKTHKTHALSNPPTDSHTNRWSVPPLLWGIDQGRSEKWGNKHKGNEAPFYFSERQTMSRCFGQYVQQLSANKRLYNSPDSVSPYREFLHSEYLFFEHTTTRSLLQIIAIT